MRLIDADAMLARLEEWNTSDSTDKALYNFTLHRILEQPTIEPQRKKGKWVGYDGDWLKTMCKCSECGAMIDINEKYRNFFCYHCGARMEDE